MRGQLGRGGGLRGSQRGSMPSAADLRAPTPLQSLGELSCEGGLQGQILGGPWES